MQTIISGTKYDDINLEWRITMNDANYIYPRGNNDGAKFDNLFHEQKHRIDAVYQQCDIMMSHVSPLNDREQFEQMYGEVHDYRAFYCFNGKEYLENGSMKYWIFGHTHRKFNRTYTREDGSTVDILCNSIGYPKDEKNPDEFQIRTIEFSL